MKTRFILAGCLALVSFTFVATAADTNVEQALRDLDTQWSRAAAAKDVDKTVSYYSDGAIVLPPNAPGVTTKDAIRKLWSDIIGSSTSMSWTATRVEVAKSGDMAFASGTYEMTSKDAGGKTTNDRGKYLEVWQKQADGTWKCAADMFSSDLPVAPSATAAEKK